MGDSLPPDTSGSFGVKPEVGGEGPSLREIAQTLTTPARAGLVLTRERIGTLAHELSLPVGFGERSQMLMNMFRAAAELGSISALLAALTTEVDRWDARYVEWGTAYPASAAIWNEWRTRLAESRTLLNDMAAAASHTDAAERPE